MRQRKLTLIRLLKTHPLTGPKLIWREKWLAYKQEHR